MKKVISLFFLLLLFSSLLSKGNVKMSTMSCCPYMCGKMPLPDDGKKEKKGNSQNCCGCNAMVPASAPVYITAEPLTLKPLISQPVRTGLSSYRSGELSDHHSADWKPPKSTETPHTT